MIRRSIHTIVNAGGLLAGICIAMIVAIIAFEVFCRYILSSPTYWALEISIYLLVAMVSLGAPYTLRVGGHVAVEIVHDMLPGTARLLADRVNLLIVAGFGLVLLWYGVGEVRHAWRLGVFSLTPLAMPLVYPLTLIPICGLLLTVQAVELLFYPEFQSDSEQDEDHPVVTE